MERSAASRAEVDVDQSMSARLAHAHGAASPPVLPGNQRRRVITLLVLLLLPAVAATAAGVVWLWPRQQPDRYLAPEARYAAAGVTSVRGTVDRVVPYICEQGSEGAQLPARRVVCARVSVVLAEGPDAGRSTQVDVPAAVVDAGIYPGNGVSLMRVPPVDGEPAAYAFAEFTRDLPLAVLAVAFALLVVVVARLRGLFALAGLLFAFAVIGLFVLPALLAGRSPLLVGVVGSAAIMFVALYLAHGISIRTTTALVGTLFGLGSAALLGTWAVSAAQLTGAATEESQFVATFAGDVNLSGLLLCGIVIGTLGVLNDVTVTQASAVWELQALQPGASATRLFAGGMRIGRDHIASTVYTIAFAYAGSALPILLLIHLYQRPLWQTLTTEALAQEVVSILVGAIGLVLAVPLTTAVGVVLIKATGSRRAAVQGAPTVAAEVRH
jgi:uncharacterized membrane protein